MGLHAGDPVSANIFLSSVPIDNGAVATAPTTGYKNQTLFTAPRNEGKGYRIRSVTISWYTSPIDATDDVTVAIKTVSAAGVADATQATGISVKSTAVADKASLEIWRGIKDLTPGMSLEAEITATTPDTAGFGGTYTVEGEILDA